MSKELVKRLVALENVCYEEDSDAILEAADLLESQAKKIAAYEVLVVQYEANAESQARVIEELKADAAERNADHGKLVDENHALRAALVEAIMALERCTKYTDADYEALTRCKEVLK
jgi:hypothetical protein